MVAVKKKTKHHKKKQIGMSRPESAGASFCLNPGGPAGTYQEGSGVPSPSRNDPRGVPPPGIPIKGLGKSAQNKGEGKIKKIKKIPDFGWTQRSRGEPPPNPPERGGADL